MKMRIIILAFTICSCQASKEDCPRPPLKNGFFVPHMETYKHGAKTSYGCNTGLKPALQTWWGEITCSHGNWTHTPECIIDTWCIVPDVAHAQPAGEVGSSFAPGYLEFKCDHGYVLDRQKSKAQCEDGKWKVLPECKRARGFCAPPPRVTNGMIKDPYKDLFESDNRLEYVCAGRYELVGSAFSTCRDGEWSPQPRCVLDPSSCPAPDVPHAQPTHDQLQPVYRTGSSIIFECDNGYEFENRDRYYAQCTSGTWRLPVCQPKCPSPRVPNARLREDQRGTEFYPTGAHVYFECNSGYEFLRRDHYYAKCEKGDWKLPTCKQSGGSGGALVPDEGPELLPVGACGSQPLIHDGDVTELPGEKELKVQCKVLYKLVGPDRIRCVEEKWTALPVCKPPCSLDKTRIHSENAYEYLQEGERKEYYCPESTSWLRWMTRYIQCFNGAAYYNECS